MKRIVNDSKLLKFTHVDISDVELFSSMLYCKHLLERKDESSNEEFNDFNVFFFNDNKDAATSTLEELYNYYMTEYFKRQQN